MRKLTFLISFCLCIALHATTSKTVNISFAGTLSSYFITAEDSAVTNLTITGNIDARDFDIIYYLTYFDLENLNIENANIVAYEGTEVTYPANELLKHSFRERFKLKSIILPKTLTSIGKYSFSCTVAPGSLDSLNIPEGVTVIRDSCFINQGLTFLTLPSTLDSLGNSSFKGAYNLSVVTNLNPTPIEIDITCFEYVNKSVCTLYVPYGSGDAYRSADVWKEFNVVELPEETTAINETTTDSTKKTVIAYYSIAGIKLSNEPKSGIYIVVYSNGESEKRMINENFTTQ